MTTALIILVVVVVLVWLASRQSREAPSHEAAERASTAPALTVTISRSSASSTERQVPDGGVPQRTSDDCWILNPKSPFPLTIAGVDEPTIQALRSALERLYSDWDWELRNEITGIVARSNLRCKELDAYCTEYRPKFEAAIRTRQAEHAEWQAASELDRQDLILQFEPEALASLDLLPCGSLEENRDLVPPSSVMKWRIQLSMTPSLIATASNSPPSTFDLLGILQRFNKVPADSWQRKKFEALAEACLARRGAEIPLEHLLASLRLKDLNEFPSHPSAKKFTRKVAAIEYLAARPNTRDQLSTRMSFRELFQLLPLPEEFSFWIYRQSHGTGAIRDAVAKTITATFRGGLSTLEEREMNRGLG